MDLLLGINLSNLPSGYYYAQITGGNSTVQKVLMKK
ncbi:T9SS type A sorting domain-containing protein [Flavobacterium microcysteis]|uniref:T9SS type A sorting domain-containing protein n=1 Tax=Flavobacterium microcysteis TaxID=2596891 RepID=A0A501QIE2_9FLAO|nr:T9SS type A sorting domain-containing protein [Flavobacterium microcysteis]